MHLLKMKKCLLLCCVAFTVLVLCGNVIAASAPIALENADINPNDMASVMRGARFFAQRCMVCHSMKYLRYNKLAQEAGITIDKMPTGDQQWTLGTAPPDLSLIGRVRSADWLYTYFHSFYSDPTRPIGANNLLVDNVNMPNPFLAMQGEQVLSVNKKLLMSSRLDHDITWYTALRRVKSGTMSEAQFDQTITDLVNFLMYASEPVRHFREEIGIWVIAFLFVLLLLTYLLKTEFWKDIKRNSSK